MSSRRSVGAEGSRMTRIMYSRGRSPLPAISSRICLVTLLGVPRLRPPVLKPLAMSYLSLICSSVDGQRRCGMLIPHTRETSISSRRPATQPGAANTVGFTIWQEEPILLAGSLVAEGLAVLGDFKRQATRGPRAGSHNKRRRPKPTPRLIMNALQLPIYR